MSSEYSDEYRCAVFVNEVKVGAGEVLEGALVSDTENDGNYPNHACQDWDIKAEEIQVYAVFQNQQPFHVKLLVSNASNSCFKGFDFFQMLLASHR